MDHPANTARHEQTVRELPERLAIRAWIDPGHKAAHRPMSLYVECCWTGFLGPTATLAYRRLGAFVERVPNGGIVDTADLAKGLGVGQLGGRSSPLARALGRLVGFGVARWSIEDVYELRPALPDLPDRVIERLSHAARRHHQGTLEQRRLHG